MPLTSPAGGSVDLIGEQIITAPSAKVLFSPLNINADKAYKVEFEIVPNYASGVGFPVSIDPQFQSVLGVDDVGFGANLQNFMQLCSFGCNEIAGSFIDISIGDTDLVTGSFTFRRFNVLNQVAGNAQQNLWDTAGGGLFEGGSGGWVVDTTGINFPYLNVLAVGVEMTNLPSLFFGVGSVFRLYKGEGS